MQIETEKLLAHLVEEEMNKRTVSFSFEGWQPHGLVFTHFLIWQLAKNYKSTSQVFISFTTLNTFTFAPTIFCSVASWYLWRINVCILSIEKSSDKSMHQLINMHPSFVLIYIPSLANVYWWKCACFFPGDLKEYSWMGVFETTAFLSNSP